MRLFWLLVITISSMLSGCAPVKSDSPAKNQLSKFVYHLQVDKDYPYQVSDEVARLGEKSQRFELREGDCEVISKVHIDKEFNRRLTDYHCSTFRERVQVGSQEWKPGDDMWWGISVYLPKDFKPDTDNICTMLMQIKQTEPNGPDMEAIEGMRREMQPGGFSASRDAYALGHGIFGLGVCGGGHPSGGLVGICVNKTWGPKMNTNYECLGGEIGDMNRFIDSWVDFTFHWDTKNYQKGESLLEVWVNGEKIGSYANVTEHFPDSYRAQFGLYRSQFGDKTNIKRNTLVAYFDEVRYGTTYNEVAVQMQRAAVD